MASRLSVNGGVGLYHLNNKTCHSRVRYDCGFALAWSGLVYFGNKTQRVRL